MLSLTVVGVLSQCMSWMKHLIRLNQHRAIKSSAENLRHRETVPHCTDRHYAGQTSIMLIIAMRHSFSVGDSPHCSSSVTLLEK